MPRSFSLQSERQAVPRRDLLFEAICEVCSIPPSELTRSARGALNRALAEIRAVNSNATAADIQARAVRYRQIYSQSVLTPSALARHWAECWTPPKPAAPPAPLPIPEPTGDWRAIARADEVFGDDHSRRWVDLSRNHQQAITRRLNAPC